MLCRVLAVQKEQQPSFCSRSHRPILTRELTWSIRIILQLGTLHRAKHDPNRIHGDDHHLPNRQPDIPLSTTIRQLGSSSSSHERCKECGERGGDCWNGDGGQGG